MAHHPVVCVAASYLHHIPVWQILAFPVTSHQVRITTTHKAMSVRMNSWKLHTSTIWDSSFTCPLVQVQFEPVHPSRSHICVAQPDVFCKGHFKLGIQADSTEGDLITMLLRCAEVKDLWTWIRYQAADCTKIHQMKKNLSLPLQCNNLHNSAELLQQLTVKQRSRWKQNSHDSIHSTVHSSTNAKVTQIILCVRMWYRWSMQRAFTGLRSALHEYWRPYCRKSTYMKWIGVNEDDVLMPGPAMSRDDHKPGWQVWAVPQLLSRGTEAKGDRKNTTTSTHNTTVSTTHMKAEGTASYTTHCMSTPHVISPRLTPA